jgi:hypothetical protein
LIWTDVQSMTRARAASLFVDLQLKWITAPAPARGAPPAATTARPQNATEPAEPTRRQVQPRPQDPAAQEAETTDGSAAVDWLLNRRR